MVGQLGARSLVLPYSVGSSMEAKIVARAATTKAVSVGSLSTSDSVVAAPEMKRPPRVSR